MPNWSTNDIIAMLDAPTEDRRPVKQQILAEAPADQVVEALNKARTPLTCQILCDILGERCEAAAVPVMINYLEYPVPSVRAAAADGLGKIGDSRAGPALLARLTKPEEDGGVLHMLVAALGATGHRPAVPHLILALDSPDPALRLVAAWSLGVLGAEEAEEPLKRSLCLAVSPHQAMITTQAWAAVQLVSRATSASDPMVMVPILSTALRDPATAAAAAWALSTLESPRARTVLRRALTSAHKYPCFVRQRMIDALLALEARNPKRRKGKRAAEL